MFIFIQRALLIFKFSESFPSLAKRKKSRKSFCHEFINCIYLILSFTSRIVSMNLRQTCKDSDAAQSDRQRQRYKERQIAKPSSFEVSKQTKKKWKMENIKKMSRPPAITFHSFPWSLSRCVLQRQRQLFWVFILFFFRLRLCCLSPRAKFLKVSHASWVFNEFGLCGPRISALYLFFFHF